MPPANPVRRPRRSLALRLSLIGLTQMVAVFVGFALLSTIFEPPKRKMFERNAGYVAARLGDVAGDRPALDRELSRARSALGCSLTVYDERGQVIATTGPVDATTSASSIRMPLALPEGKTGQLLYVPRAHPPRLSHLLLITGLVLLVVGVSSLLVTRSLTGPLATLSSAARAFGSGQLEVRARLARRDELGEVASAFDEMADRIVAVLRAQKELLANVSHELRTPLSRIRVALDLAAEGDSATARESLGEIAEDLGELERLVADVLMSAQLDLSHGGAEQLPLRKNPADLRALLDKAAGRLRASYPEYHVDVQCERVVPETIDADAALLRRAVDNLLENAAKYSEPTKGSIVVAASTTDDEVVVEVRDHGIGISTEDQAHLFTPFFRTDRSRTRSTGGLGLGLALAKRIAEAHGGTLDLESTLGTGTTVRMRIPLQASLG
jgi:signal transduction histidine kinase